MDTVTKEYSDIFSGSPTQTTVNEHSIKITEP